MADAQDTVASEINADPQAKSLNPQAEAPTSQTASEYINSQLRLEADAREVLPFSFDHCTQPLGPLRQNLFACLTCNPPPSSTEPYTPAAVCYSCSIACHGEHTLVELFHRRDFTCDCGTTRLPATSPCTLRIDPATGLKGPVHSQEAATGNTYNHNFKNRFCDCEDWYEADKEKGTMFQCLGLASEADGGCGEDWWHPDCVVSGGIAGRITRTAMAVQMSVRRAQSRDSNEEEGEQDDEVQEIMSLPPEFPREEDFETFICFKCLDAVPWLKRYAGTEGFLPAVVKRSAEDRAKEFQARGTTASASTDIGTVNKVDSAVDQSKPATTAPHNNGLKRSAEDATLDNGGDSKRSKSESGLSPAAETSAAAAYHTQLPPAPPGPFSLFCKEDFRDQLCRCRECYPALAKYPQLLEEEDNYEPPLSEEGDAAADGTASVGSKSLLDRGEEALSNVDRVRAIGLLSLSSLPDRLYDLGRLSRNLGKQKRHRLTWCRGRHGLQSSQRQGQVFPPAIR